MSKKIAVIDGHSLMHRAYHAVPPAMNAPDGRPTNAVFGFISMLLKLIDVAQPDAIVCAFDEGRPAFRTEALERYKAQRPPIDDDLKVQFPMIEELLEAMDIPVIRVPGWEGDDILGTVAARDEALGYETLLVTGDRDAYQLATELTRIVTTKKGISDVTIYGPDEVEDRYGITPAQVPDYLGLMPLTISPVFLVLVRRPPLGFCKILDHSKVFMRTSTSSRASSLSASATIKTVLL
ncbi:MAG: hypothetical protein RR619_11110 [Raoultibacter sp.]